MKKMIRKTLTLLTFTIFIFSCAPIVDYTSFDGIGRVAKTESDTIDVFTSSYNIHYKFKEIGLISIKYSGSVRKDLEILTAAKNKARNMGADGIIYLNENTISRSGFEGYSTGLQDNIVRFSAIIRLKEN